MTGRIPRSLILAAALALLAGAAGAAETVAPCAALDPPVDHDGLRDCLLERERVWGPDDPRMLTFLDAAALASGGQATQALPYRRRAYALTSRLNGPGRETADAALAYARSWILSGRCTAMDARIRPLVAEAARGYAALPADDPARSEGLRAAAHAEADGLAYSEAAATLMLIEPAPEASDWERIGRWRRYAGDPAGAAAAFETARDGERDPHRRARLTQTLKRLYFELGDLEAAARLGAAD